MKTEAGRERREGRRRSRGKERGEREKEREGKLKRLPVKEGKKEEMKGREGV